MSDKDCWRRFLNEVYDDFAVAGQGDGAFLNARTVCAWSAVIGQKEFDADLKELETGKSVRILADYLSAGPEERVLELQFYV
jgi:hypothetical protein